MTQERIVILGAAGRDFHNFNTFYRDRSEVKFVAFTATQIPGIEERSYPTECAGPLYPEGIPIVPEGELEKLIKEEKIDTAVFSYSDVSYDYLMNLASRVLAAGASFLLLNPEETMIASTKPVVSICAVRTGCGKSQTTRKVAEILREKGKKVVAVRHPMPYGDLRKQIVQRFATLEDMDAHQCTIEEREEYEPHITAGTVVYAGVDYEKILREAEKEGDVILWDGGNNDLPFYKPDLDIVVADPHRAGHERRYFPGEVNFIRADVIVINKVDTAERAQVDLVIANAKELNPDAVIIEAASPLTVEKGDLIKGKRVLVVEDGPTLTHGEMKYGAGVVAAKKYGAKELVDPRPYTVGSIKKAFEKYPFIDRVLPALGYGDRQVKELQEVIKKVDCDLIIIGTPIDLRKLIDLPKPSVKVDYALEEKGKPDLRDALEKIV